MRKSFWSPAWWVFLPVAVPLVWFFWAWLGEKLGMQVLPTPDPLPDPGYPAWLQDGYYAVQEALIFLIGWASMLLVMIHDALGGDSGFFPMWLFNLGIGISVIAHCLILYGALVLTRRLRGGSPRVIS
jgi:hypothetical protein